MFRDIGLIPSNVVSFWTHTNEIKIRARDTFVMDYFNTNDTLHFIEMKNFTREISRGY